MFYYLWFLLSFCHWHSKTITADSQFLYFFLIQMDILDFLSQCTLLHTTFKTVIHFVRAHDGDG